MPRPLSKLDRPALDIVVRIARGHLRAATDAWDLLRRGDGDEALHDFRVAIRRLRSTLQAYRPLLDDVVKAKDRRRLRRMMDETSTARDLEVQIAHLRALRREIAADAEPTVARLVRQLRHRARTGHSIAAAEVETAYPQATQALDRRLRRVTASATALPLRFVIGPLIATHARVLRPLLEDVPSLGDTRTLHQTRIEVKRTRYLLEPLRRALPGATTLVQRLVRLQDLLGELRDFQVLERALPAGCPALRRLVRERQRRLHATLLQEWFGVRASVVLDPLDLLAVRLGAQRHLTLPYRPARAPRAVAVVNVKHG
jgi:CHAD domain-containing protein